MEINSIHLNLLKYDAYKKNYKLYYGIRSLERMLSYHNVKC